MPGLTRFFGDELAAFRKVLLAGLPSDAHGWRTRAPMRGTTSGETMEAIPIEEFVEVVKRA